LFLSKGYKKIYYLFLKDEATGKRKKISTGTTVKSEANKFMLDYFQQTKTIDPIPIVHNKTISEIKDEVLLYAKNSFSPGTFKIYMHTIGRMINILGDKPIKLMSFKDFEYYKTERLKSINKTSVNIEVRNIKAIFNFIIKLGYLKENPAIGIKQFSIPQKEKLSFSKEDIQKLLSVIDSSLIKNVMLFGLFTGCRINEILNIQLKNVDVENRWIDIINKPDFKTKTGKARRIPISDELYSTIIQLYDLEEFNNSPERYLFSSAKFQRYHKNFISKKFKDYLRKASLPEKYHFHCLRHTFITNLIKNGVNLNYVKELAGHTDINTTMGYIHIETEDLREAVNKVTIGQ
jgi:site-specific recombinase XerD